MNERFSESMRVQKYRHPLWDSVLRPLPARVLTPLEPNGYVVVGQTAVRGKWVSQQPRPSVGSMVSATLVSRARHDLPVLCKALDGGEAIHD